MKCVKKIPTGMIIRVTNEQAASLVNHKVAVYVSKKEWKEQTRTSTGKLAKVGI